MVFSIEVIVLAHVRKKKVYIITVKSLPIHKEKLFKNLLPYNGNH